MFYNIAIFVTSCIIALPLELCMDYLTAPDGYSWLERKRNKDKRVKK